MPELPQPTPSSPRADDALGFWLVGVFTVGGVLLALSTIALVAVQA